MDVRTAAPPAYGRPAPMPSQRSSSSTWIIVLAIVGGMMLLIIPCLIALLLPAVQQAREAARRTQCKNNLKQIGLALHNYHDTYDCFPPAYIADEDGTPMHSWRVLILPFLEEGPLYNRYDFSQPWDSPANLAVMQQMPAVYRCPSHPDEDVPTMTAYAAVSGEDTIFEGDEPVALRDITDGSSNTIMVGEAAHAGIPWTSPTDVDIHSNSSIGDPDGFSSDHAGGAQFLMADGAVRFISENILQQTLDNLFRRNDGNAVGGF